jgi:hypothetical protein
MKDKGVSIITESKAKRNGQNSWSYAMKYKNISY